MITNGTIREERGFSFVTTTWFSFVTTESPKHSTARSSIARSVGQLPGRAHQ